MKYKKSSLFSRKPITTRILNNLVKKALKDKPKMKPSKGKVFLKDLEPATMFSCYLCRGIFIKSDGSSTVVITDWYGREDHSAYYLGQQRWADLTEVTIEEE